MFQHLCQLIRVVVFVHKAVHALGDQPGGAGVLRHDGGLAEDQALGDEGWHGIIAGSAYHAGALIHQGFDLGPFQTLAVENGVRVVLHQCIHGVLQALVRRLAHEQESSLLAHLGL